MSLMPMGTGTWTLMNSLLGESVIDNDTSLYNEIVDTI